MNQEQSLIAFTPDAYTISLGNDHMSHFVLAAVDEQEMISIGQLAQLMRLIISTTFLEKVSPMQKMIFMTEGLEGARKV